MNVWQVVGYKNSGKTTLIEKWVKIASSEGYRVGTIKHHGHGGEPERRYANADSERHERAGAVCVSVEGDGLLELHARRPSWSLAQILSFYQLLPLDFVLVEGYKSERYPKVVMVRNEEDWDSLSQLSNIIAVIMWQPFSQPPFLSYPLFSIDDEKSYLHWLMNEVRKNDE
ncbi:molybdopterin-guanine dinucleotide biosynthesis protein B [Parageobacillus genomosp. 1]|uniref:Molybdopterin-guanine dinucleotide biosynthesis protein B n=1 Tax=Parageobacillus genomosp. 1 TaxID=1295642 RepID=A0ABC9VIU2_9BACL|nr:molybdopterin-guanine dinucleotide biosynthesis protein B [Parageobacillus genomosp. 1]EZP78787.1 molybdopterin-guanine dinucleotide biosynthesis protein B [Parageobacillus genomosp. 1]